MYENYEHLRSKYGSAIPADCCDPLLDVVRDREQSMDNGPTWDDSRYRLMRHLENGISNWDFSNPNDKTGIYRA